MINQQQQQQQQRQQHQKQQQQQQGQPKRLGRMMSAVLLLLLILLPQSSNAITDQCMERYKICSVKERLILQKICRRSGGLLKHAFKYAAQEIFSDCCQSSGCSRQYLCEFCENSCCQIAIDTVMMDKR